MKVILLHTVPKVGKKGDVVEVSDGYAANALFPTKKAIIANTKNLASHNRKVQSEADVKALQIGLLEHAIAGLPDMTVEIKVRANEKGHLFSRVDTDTIVAALLTHRISVSKKNIILPEAIKTTGTYQIEVQEGSYRGEITVAVVAL